MADVGAITVLEARDRLVEALKDLPEGDRQVASAAATALLLDGEEAPDEAMRSL